MLGYCTIENIECTYYKSNHKLILFPLDIKKVCLLYKKINNDEQKVIELYKSYSEDAYDLLYFTNVYLLTDNNIECKVDFYFEFYTKDKVTGLQLYSDELTSYISPAEYYYFQKSSKSDLLYDSELLHQFSIEYQNEILDARVISGDILRRGISSELKLDTRLEIDFQPTKNTNKIIDLFTVIHKSLQFLVYSKEINYKRIELTTVTEKGISIIGRMFITKKDINTQNRHFAWKSSFVYLKDYLSNIISEIAKDNHLYIKHLPDEINGHNMNITRIISIFASFESEFSKLPDEYRLIDTTNIEKLREDMINSINSINVTTEEEQHFRNIVDQSIKNIGRQYGTRKKLFKSYEFNKASIKSSFEMFRIDEEAFKRKIDNIIRVRNKIIHNNFDGAIDNELDFHIIEWLTYAMFLKRCGVKENDIELTLGRLFNCNTADINHKINKPTQE